MSFSTLTIWLILSILASAIAFDSGCAGLTVGFAFLALIDIAALTLKYLDQPYKRNKDY